MMGMLFRRRDTSSKSAGRIPIYSLAVTIAAFGALGTIAAERPSAPVGDSTSSSKDWAYYNGNPAGTHYSTLDQITTRNVHNLKVVWTYDTGDAINGNGFSKSDMESNPLIVAGRMWFVSPKGRLICLDAATGKEHWTYNPAETPVTTPQRLRGVSYWTDGKAERILFTFGKDLLSIDAVTGKRDPLFDHDGRVDMREGFGRDVERLTVNNASPGAIYKDLIIMGSTGLMPGDVRAFDVRTGNIRWTFHTIPHPGEAGYETWPANAWKTEIGANVWAGFTLDRERGMVFLPTASGGMLERDFYGPTRTGSNRFANSLVALDANTGKRLWDFQSVHHDMWDRDFPTQPTLVTVEREGHVIPAIAQPAKSGFIYILDRVTGKSLFPIEERPVPPSDVPGEHASPTQPFPLVPAPLTRQQLTTDILTTRTPAAHAAALALFNKYRSGGQFIPPSLQGTIIFPGLDGGAEWGGAAYDPETGLLYVNANEMPWLLKLKPRPPLVAGTGGKSLYLNTCASCHGEDRKGSPPTIPALEDVSSIGFEQIIHQIHNGGGRMPGFGGVLTGPQEKAIAHYLLTGEDLAPTSGSTRGESGGMTAASFDSPAYIFEGYKRVLDPDGYPIVTPPWGTLNALNVSSGKYAWRIPFGAYPELEKQGVRDTGSENYGGAVVTRGGLLFIGATSYDAKFHAYDKRTGQLLWEAKLPAGGNATPATYMISGRQYVVIGAGGGKDSRSAPGGTIVAFALEK